MIELFCSVCGAIAVFAWIADRVTKRGTWEVYECENCKSRREFCVK